MSTTDGTLVTKQSPSSVDDTVSNLEAALTARGLKLFAVIDHSGEAEAAGLSLRESRVVIFGSPQAGTPVMEAAPLAALDLPLKVLVWSDGGHTKVTSIAPSALGARYGLPAGLVGRLSGIDALTDAAVRG